MTTPIAEAAAAELAPPAVAIPPAPLASRIADTFFAPSRVFAQFQDGNAPWLGATLVCIAASLLMVALTPLFISNQHAAEFVLQRMSEMGTAAANLPTVDEMAARMPFQYAMRAVGIVIVTFIMIWIFALVLWGISAAMLGGRAPLRSHAAVVSHSFLIPTLGAVLVGVLQFITGRLDLTLDAALLAPGVESGSVTSALLHSLSPFSLWLLVLLGLGAAVINRRKNWIGVALVLFAIQTALVVGGSLLMQMIKGRAAGG